MSGSGASAIIFLSISLLLLSATAALTAQISTDIGDNIESSGNSIENDIEENFILSTRTNDVFDESSNSINFTVQNVGSKTYNIDDLPVEVLINGQETDPKIETSSTGDQWKTSAKFIINDTSSLSNNSENTLIIIVSRTEIKSKFFSDISIEVQDWNDLDQGLRNNPDENFILSNSIDQNTNGYQTVVDQDGFTPIDKFTGSFYGQENTISDIKVSSNSSTVGGLFNKTSGNVYDLVIKSSVVEANTTGVNTYGVLTGIISSDAKVRNVHIGDNSVVDSQNVVGGLAGLNKGEIVHSSFQGGDSIGNEKVGGLVGVNSGLVTDSYALAQVYGSDDTGGLIGLDNSNRDISVKTSYVSTDVENPAGNFSNGNFGNVAGRVDTADGEGIYFDQDINNNLSDSVGSGSYIDTTDLTQSGMKGSSAETNMGQLNFQVLWDTYPNDFPILRSIDKSIQIGLR